MRATPYYDAVRGTVCIRIDSDNPAENALLAALYDQKAVPAFVAYSDDHCVHPYFQFSLQLLPVGHS